MPNRALIMIAAMPLIMEAAGCASSPGARGVGNVTKSVPVLTPPTSPMPAAPAVSEASQDAKTFGEAVERGDKAWQANQLDRAVYNYVLALERSPTDAPTLAKIGAIEEQRGNIALANKAFEMAHAAQPDDPRIAERLAQLYMQQARVEDAAQIYAQVLALHPQRARALDGMGAVCIRRAEYVQSIQYFDRALQTDNADAPTILTHRGYVKLLVNDLPGAETDLRAALSVAPQPDTWRYLANLQVRRRDTAGALESLLKVMDSAHAYNEIGVVFMSTNDYQEAQTYFSKAISTSATWYEEAQRNLELAGERLKGALGKDLQ